MTRYQQPELADQLAAEYVLGTLTGRARQRFERLLRASPELRTEVEAWELRLNKLAHFSEPEIPPVQVWSALEQRLFNGRETAAAKNQPGWYEKLAFWRGLTVGSGLLAAVLAILLVVGPDRNPVPNYVVVLSDKANQPVWTLSTASSRDQIMVNNLKPMQIPQGKICQLWVKPEGSEQLYSLGTLPDTGGALALNVDTKLRDFLTKGKLLVTVEDAGNPALLSPSGAVEFSGKMLPLTRL